MATKRTRKKAAPSETVLAGPVMVNALIPPVTGSSEVPSAYINNIELLSMNVIDVRIAFNEIIAEDSGDGKQPRLARYRRANLVMSPSQFIAIVNMLNAAAQAMLATQQQQAADALKATQQMHEEIRTAIASAKSGQPK